MYVYTYNDQPPSFVRSVGRSKAAYKPELSRLELGMQYFEGAISTAIKILAYTICTSFTAHLHDTQVYMWTIDNQLLDTKSCVIEIVLAFLTLHLKTIQ